MSDWFRKFNFCGMAYTRNKELIEPPSIESTFGVTKARMSDDKLVGVSTMILVIPLRLRLAEKGSRFKFNFKERLEHERLCNIKQWADENLSPNLMIKRINTIGKKCVGF